MKPTDPDFRDLYRLFYERRMEHMRSARQLQGEYGRWLIASLVLIHGSSIVFLAQGEEFGQKILRSTHWWFVSGLVLALVCGFITWLNWGLHEAQMDNTSPDMIYDLEKWPVNDPKIDRWINTTYMISISIGLGSAICIIGAAITASFQL